MQLEARYKQKGEFSAAVETWKIPTLVMLDKWNFLTVILVDSMDSDSQTVPLQLQAIAQPVQRVLSLCRPRAQIQAEALRIAIRQRAAATSRQKRCIIDG